MAGKKAQGPQLDPVKVAQFERGFNGEDSQRDPASIASALAQAYAAKMNGGGAAAPSPSPTPAPAMNEHMLNMQQAAEAAKLKYMQEHGVDENGDSIQK